MKASTKVAHPFWKGKTRPGDPIDLSPQEAK
jgi:hypothetical protein